MNWTPDWPSIAASRSLFIASPLYGNSLTFGFHNSILNLFMLAARHRIRIGSKCIGCDSLVPRARNRLVAHFLDSACTDLLFIDSDITFSPEDALFLLSLPEPIVGGVYPRKQLNWDLISRAAKAGVPSHLLSRYGYVPVVNWLPGEFRTDSLLPVHHIGTGFLRIRREVFTTLIAKGGEDFAFNYGDDERESRDGILGYDLFPCGPDARFPTSSGHRKYLSEDYGFCELARAAGYTIHAAPWIRLVHSGFHDFHGDINALDPSMMTEDASRKEEPADEPISQSPEVSLARVP